MYPENTMLAFKKAEETGADAVEMDIQLTKDGTVVIIHDESVDRVTGAKGFVRDFTFEELRKLNASQAVYGDTFGFNSIPSLEEYFIWAKDTNIITDIELKNNIFYYEGLEEKAIALIKKYGLEKRVMLQSQSIDSLKAVHQKLKGVPCMYISHTVPKKNLGKAVQSLPGFVKAVSVTNGKTTEKLRRAMHRRNIKLAIYTVTGKTSMKNALLKKPDIIFTDNVRTSVAVLAK
jgi:glycerophosphoryl diester phosphodiesterase